MIRFYKKDSYFYNDGHFSNSSSLTAFILTKLYTVDYQSVWRDSNENSYCQQIKQQDFTFLLVLEKASFQTRLSARDWKHYWHKEKQTKKWTFTLCAAEMYKPIF